MLYIFILFNLEDTTKEKKGIIPLREASLHRQAAGAYLTHLLGRHALPPQDGSCSRARTVLGTEKVHHRGVKGLGLGRPVDSSAFISAVQSVK